MGWVRRRWKVLLIALAAATYVADLLVDGRWPWGLFALAGGGFAAVGRAWDAQRAAADEEQVVSGA